MNFQHFLEMLEIMLQHFQKMLEILCIKNARNEKSTFDLRWPNYPNPASLKDQSYELKDNSSIQYNFVQFEDFLRCQNYWMQYFLTHWFQVFPFVSISNFPRNATSLQQLTPEGPRRSYSCFKYNVVILYWLYCKIKV